MCRRTLEQDTRDSPRLAARIKRDLHLFENCDCYVYDIARPWTISSVDPRWPLLSFSLPSTTCHNSRNNHLFRNSCSTTNKSLVTQLRVLLNHESTSSNASLPLLSHGWKLCACRCQRDIVTFRPYNYSPQALVMRR